MCQVGNINHQRLQSCNTLSPEVQAQAGPQQCQPLLNVPCVALVSPQDLWLFFISYLEA